MVLDDFLGQITPLTTFTFAGGIVVSLITSYIYEWMLGKLTFRTREYPDLKGVWKVDVSLEGLEPFTETVKITSQVNRKFRGEYISPAIGRLATAPYVTLVIDGVLLDHRTIRYIAHSKRNENLDYVCGMAIISNDRSTITGCSISMGILTEVPTVAKVKFEYVG